MVNWKLVYTNQAKKDAKKLANNHLKEKALAILAVLEQDPFQPPYEKLVKDLKGTYSRRINIQHRIIYQLFQKEKIVKIIRMWTHYE